MKYKFMIGVAGILALFSSSMTALGMASLFAASGLFILILFVVIDLGRFILFNFLVDEWKNLRKIKYVIIIILALLFIYSGVGIYAKLDDLVAPTTRQAMINAAYYNKSNQNANINEEKTEDFLKIAKREYENALDWNKKDHENCLTRAQKAADIAEAENKCNNTKRRLDKNALATLQAAQNDAKQALTASEDTIQKYSKNKDEIAAILTTICKISQKQCTEYDDLQFAFSIIIILVIIGTDYLQMAIILAVNTRKNKKEIIETQVDTLPIKEEIPPKEIKKSIKTKPQVKDCKIPTENNIIFSAKSIIPQKESIKVENKLKLDKKIIQKVETPQRKRFFFSGAKPSNHLGKS